MLIPMRFRLFILALALIAACPAALSAGTHVAKPGAHVSKKDRQAAEKEFRRALELQQAGKLEDALQAAKNAASLFPGNLEYQQACEMLRQQIVGRYLTSGNNLAKAGDLAGAQAQFRAALDIDPANTYAIQRLRDVSPAEDPDHRRTMELLASLDAIDVEPAPGKKSIHVRGDTRSVYTQIGALFNVTVRFDSAVASKPIRFDLDDVDFYTAMAVAGMMSKTFWAPVSKNEIIVATDTQEMRRTYERMSMRSFYIGNATAPSDVSDIVNALRNIFDIKLINVEPGKNTITLRAPRATVEAAASFIENLMAAKPEVMLEVSAYEFDTNKAAAYGVDLPNSFQVFNVASEIRRVLGPDAQSVIAQLLQTGTVNPASIPAADLAKLQGSPLLSSFITFGKGLGLTAITIGPVTAHLSLNSSVIANLENANLRALDGETTTFRVGDRFPIVTAFFSTTAVTAQGQAPVGNTPQFQYEDLGLTLKIKPHYHVNDEIRLDFDLKIEGLGAASLNGIPELTQRAFLGTITVKAGEPSVITGEIDEQQVRSTTGYPGIGQVPVVKEILNSNSNQRTHNQILVVVTPRVIRRPLHDKGTSVFWNLGP
jgi:general secretion pathway protein D